MDQHAAKDNSTQDRLELIERELRRWRLGCSIILSVAAIIVATAMAEPPAKELRVHTLRVVDREGKDRIVLTAETKVPDLVFFDPQGKSRLTLDIADDHKPVLAFSESGRESRLTVGMEEGVPMLALFDEAGKKRVTFGIPKDGGSVLRVLDAHGKLQTRLP